MAMVHPSRMGLVPQDSSLRPRRESPRRARSRSRSAGRSRSRDRRDSRLNDRRRDNPRREDNEDRARDRDRRPSPSYDEYRGRQQEPVQAAPWRQTGAMYPPRGQDMPPLPDPSGANHARTQVPYGGGGSGWLDSRRAQRAAMSINIWPKSPEPRRNDDSDDDRHRSSKKHGKRRRSPSPTDSSSDEERRRRKEKKHSRHSESKKSKSHRSSKHKRRHDSSPERSRSRSRSPKRHRSRNRDDDDVDDWVEKPTSAPLAMSIPRAPAPVVQDNHPVVLDDGDEEPGPSLENKASGGPKTLSERAYGGQLLRGEGSAMAAFLQSEDGTKARIPRRGEIGLLPDQIEAFESVGYVMSGSRHRRMNAVRMRKENQVISAEEKRAVLNLQKEEKERREALLREEFKELVQDKLKNTVAGPRQ